MKTISITDKAIRIKINLYYEQIKDIKKDIETVRSSCIHSDTKRATYEWAIGHTVDNTLVCAHCDKLLMTEEDKYWKTY